MLEKVISVIVYLVVAGLILFVLQWGLAQISPPEPFATIARVVLVLAVVVIICYGLLKFLRDGGGDPGL